MSTNSSRRILPASLAGTVGSPSPRIKGWSRGGFPLCWLLPLRQLFPFRRVVAGPCLHDEGQMMPPCHWDSPCFN